MTVSLFPLCLSFPHICTHINILSECVSLCLSLFKKKIITLTFLLNLECPLVYVYHTAAASAIDSVEYRQVCALLSRACPRLSFLSCRGSPVSSRGQVEFRQPIDQLVGVGTLQFQLTTTLLSLMMLEPTVTLWNFWRQYVIIFDKFLQS